RLGEDVDVRAEDLIAVDSLQARPTYAGLVNAVQVGIRYIEAWLRGLGAVAIFNLMEDAATAEISRSQIWQWLHNDVTLDDGAKVTTELVERLISEELATIRETTSLDADLLDRATALFKEVALAEDYAEFLTLPAYERMP
ncbi:MAG UNVERIFIED_CONTAM: malate synthase A, partial [Thermobifida fusca]